MARIRSIKPEFWTSPQIVELSIPARLLFIGLWNFADDHGRHEFNLKRMLLEVFPADGLSSETIQGMFNELSTNGLVETYEVDGKGYFQITGWHHQRIDKPQLSRYPAPPNSRSKNDPRTFATEGRREGRRRGGTEGKELTRASPDKLSTLHTLPPTQPTIPTSPVSPLREEAQGGVREESFQSSTPEKKQGGSTGGHAAYPDQFEGLWETYQEIASPNSVKAEAYKLWRKLNEIERSSCSVGLMSYAADLQTTREKRPDAPAKYLETFIAKRAWEPLIDEKMAELIRQTIEARHAGQ